MYNAPLPLPLSKLFIDHPYDFLSIEQLRLVHEAQKKKGAITYVLGK